MRRPESSARYARVTPIPGAVRDEAAAAGIALHEDAWLALPVIARLRLAAMPTGDAVERQVFASLLVWLLRTFPPDVDALSRSA
jgi:hypothetical protein